MGIYIPNIEKPKKVDGIKIDFHFEDGHIESHIIGIEEIIDIVTCEECIHHNDGICHRPKWPFAVEPTDFCSYGERRSE